MTSTLITLGVIGAAAYLAWQWLQSACGAGGSMTGNWMCGALGVSPAAAVAATPVTATFQQTGSNTGTITVTGPANTPVTVNGEQVGTTNSSGSFTMQGNLSAAQTITFAVGTGSASVSIPAAQGSTTVSTPAASTPATVSTPAASSSSTSAITSTLQQLASQNAFFVQQGGEGDAYQWSALWTQAGQPSFNVNSIFYPNGIAAASGSGTGFSSGNLPLISVSQFLSALSSAGISPSGMSGINRIPAAMIHLGRVM